MKKLIARLIGTYLNLLALVAPRAVGQRGFYLFCSPQRTPLKDHQKKFLNTADRFSFLRDGVLVQGYRWGSGERKILFLHGWQSHTFRWKNYIDALSKEEFTIYALDAPGHGLSGGKYLSLPAYSDVLEEFLAHIQPFDTIIGHSLGSLAILYTNFRLSSLPAKRLVITGTASEAKEFMQFFKKVAGLSNRTMNAIYKSFQERFHQPPDFFSGARFAQAVNVPMLIIHDETDDEAPYSHILDIHRTAKNSKLITTSGLNHNLRSATVVKHVVDFVTDSKQDRKSADELAVNVMYN